LQPDIGHHGVHRRPAQAIARAVGKAGIAVHVEARRLDVLGKERMQVGIADRRIEPFDRLDHEFGLDALDVGIGDIDGHALSQRPTLRSGTTLMVWKFCNP
jgi:hypothetical protein